MNSVVTKCGANMAVWLNLLFCLTVSLLQITWACPEHTQRLAQSIPTGFVQNLKGYEAFKGDEIKDMIPPVVMLASIKAKLKEIGIFDPDNVTLTDREQKELKKLFDTVEIMTTSRARQPSNVQNVFSSLRMVERVVNKQLREGQLSQSLAAKFRWDRLPSMVRTRREQPMYRLNKNRSMRIFNVDS